MKPSTLHDRIGIAFLIIISAIALWVSIIGIARLMERPMPEPIANGGLASLAVMIGILPFGAKWLERRLWPELRAFRKATDEDYSFYCKLARDLLPGLDWDDREYEAARMWHFDKFDADIGENQP